MRAYARSGSEVGIGEIVVPVPFPFSLSDQESNSSEFCGVLVSPSEI